jgi:hypothetical protein
MYPLAMTISQVRRSTRFGEVSVFTIRMKISTTLAYMSVKVATAPPIQTENGAVARMTPPRAKTPISSGVTRVSVRPRCSLPKNRVPSAKIAASSGRCSMPSERMVSCGRK